MFKQISEYFDLFFSKYQCSFRKGFCSQHCLAAMLEKWQSAIENKKPFGALLTDLSKAFACLPHDLLTAKLNAYGFSMKSLRLIQKFLSNRKQRTKRRANIDKVKQLFQWFSDNHMKANPDKCHLICGNDDQIILSSEGEVMKNSKCRKLLGIKFDSRFTFKNHTEDIFKKAGQKIYALSRINIMYGFY